MELSWIYNIILSVIVSSIVSLIIEEIMFRLRVPQTTESKGEYHGRLYWESKPPLNKPNTLIPQKTLKNVIEIFGSPSCIDRNKGGSAVWKQSDLKTTKFVRAEIIDEMIPHSKPTPHYDFFTTWIPMNISKDREKHLHEISESIGYDPLKKWFYARCNDLRPNVVSTWIVKKYASGEYTLERAKSEYGSRIIELMKDKNGINGDLYKKYYFEI